MMISSERFLLVDTADRIAMVGLYDGDRKIWENRAMDGRPTIGWVDRSIQEALSAAAWRLSDLGFLACGIGPGGFSSLRIGLALIKAVGHTLSMPVVGVNRLEAAAMGHVIRNESLAAAASRRYLVCWPAAREQEYVAGYRVRGSSLPVCVRRPAMAPILKKQSKSLEILAPTPEDFFLGIPRVALLKARAGEVSDAKDLLPMYLRKATLGPAGSALKVARRRLRR